MSQGATTSLAVTVSGAIGIDTAHPTTNGYGAVTVTNAATLILAADSGRQYVEIVNAGSGTLYLGFDASVTTSGATMGIPVYPRGCWVQDGTAISGTAIYGIYSQAAASQNVSYMKGNS